MQQRLHEDAGFDEGIVFRSLHVRMAGAWSEEERAVVEQAAEETEAGRRPFDHLLGQPWVCLRQPMRPGVPGSRVVYMAQWIRRANAVLIAWSAADLAAKMRGQAEAAWLPLG